MKAILEKKRIRGKRGRGDRGKIPVIGVLKRSGKLFTEVVKRRMSKKMVSEKTNLCTFERILVPLEPQK